ncbi:hypothetical protein [Staphylococcus haemolyticus]|nr:hypothetical protein [Staphylococcus haemolyticus]
MDVIEDNEEDDVEVIDIYLIVIDELVEFVVEYRELCEDLKEQVV